MTIARQSEGWLDGSAFTLRYRAVPDANEIARIDDLVQRHGAKIEWTLAPDFERAYALIEGSFPFSLPVEASSACHAFDSAIIALAVCPSVPEALPKLQEALGGRGRPSGVSSCETIGTSVVVEWNLDETPARVVLELIDVELARYQSARKNQLLSPLPLAWWTQIAADGLSAPEIAPNRVLEALIEEHNVVP